MRWIAPILAFTAEEIWQYLPGERNESVMLNTWYEGLAELPEGFELGRPFWDKVMEVKAAVNKELENQRNAKAIGGNLQAEVTLYAEESLAGELARLGSELRFVLITSAVDIAPLAQAPAEAVDSELAGLKLLVRKTEHSKCGRCWHHLPDVGSHAEHPEICGRCVETSKAPVRSVTMRESVHPIVGWASARHHDAVFTAAGMARSVLRRVSAEAAA